MEDREGVRFTKDSFGALIITAAGELTKAEKDPANKTPSGHFPENRPGTRLLLTMREQSEAKSNLN